MRDLISKLLLVTTLFLSFTYSYSQKQIAPSCGWSVPTDPLSMQRQAVANQKIRDFITRHDLVDDDRVYTLPVVVHVIHTGTPIGSADNPTDGNINAMIQLLNNAWRKSGPSYGGVDMKIQFQLAVRGPNCSSTTGIERINGAGVPNYSSGGITHDGFPGSVDEVTVKNLSRWSNTDYINIWVVNKINGSPTSIGGFAYFAQYSDAGIDGIVINAAYANASVQTISHEMGHVFELFHTFYDNGFENTCPRADSCDYYGDLVCDTEAGRMEFACNNTNQCTGTNYVVADPAFGYTVLNNYMNYTGCPVMFTAGQKARVRAALFSFRSGLINSQALTAPTGLAPVSACLPFSNNGPSPYYGIQRVEFHSMSVYSNSSAGDRANYIDRTCNQQVTVYMGATYKLHVTGSYYNPHTFKAYIDYNSDGDFDDPGETLLTAWTDSISTDVTIPTNAVTGVPLRLRIVADNPAPGYPTFPSACQLNGTGGEGAGQIEDYAVIVMPGNVIQSTKSGQWDNTNTWTCNCIPKAGDIITVKAGHNVNITQAMGLIEFSSLTIEAGGNLSIGNNATVRQVK